MIDVETIKKYLKYNDDGTLTRILNYGSCTRPLNEKIGTYDKDGYLNTKIIGKTFKIHRLIWFMVRGEWPVGQIDHINGVKDDNRIENLRIVTNRQNCQNWKVHRNGSLVGAQYHKASKKWRSRIYIDGVSVYLGLFETKEEAHRAYMNKLDSIK